MITKESLIESIKIELGYPVITLRIKDDQISVLIDKAVRRCQSKACPTKTAERYIAGGVTSLAGLDVETVKNIYPSMSGASSGDIFDVSSMALSTGGNLNPNNPRFNDALAIIGNQAELRKLAMYDYYIDGDLLYVDDYSGSVTIEYTKNVITFEDLDSEWRGWVEAYSTALSKITEGRIRGKYKVQSGVFEVEADQLISEGTSEKTDLDSKLDNSMGYYNILR
jgi:hypothetical protein